MAADDLHNGREHAQPLSARYPEVFEEEMEFFLKHPLAEGQTVCATVVINKDSSASPFVLTHGDKELELAGLFGVEFLPVCLRYTGRNSYTLIKDDRGREGRLSDAKVLVIKDVVDLGERARVTFIAGFT